MHNIRTYQGNALDLSLFRDESFDITLVLGPMYHLYTKEDKLLALKEAVRVTRKGGYILVAYCMNEATMIQFTFKQGKIWELVDNNMLSDNFRCLSEAKDLFEMVRIEEIDELDASFTNIQREKIIAADGATNYMRECVDAMDERTFEIWMKYHLSICERMDLIGATNHSLCYVREHPLSWNISTNILYGEKDHLTSYETVSKFARQIGATLTVMKGGEHWFHTKEQIKFLDGWIGQFA